MAYEYKVIPAPTKGVKSKGLKSSADRFANAMEIAINTLAVDGWSYVRAETLPAEEREGLMGKTTVYQNIMVFRREAQVVAPVLVAIENLDDDADASDVEPVEDVAADVNAGQGDTEAPPEEAAELDAVFSHEPGQR